MIDIARCTAGIDTNGSIGGVHAHGPHHREVDDQSIVATAKPWTAVAPAANGEQQTLFAAKVHRGDNVGSVHTARDQAQPLVDHAVVDLARFIVTRVAPADNGTAKRRPNSSDPLPTYPSSSFYIPGYFLTYLPTKCSSTSS